MINGHLLIIVISDQKDDITTFSGAVAYNRTLNVAKLNPRPFYSNWWEWKHEAAPMARGGPYLKQKKVKFYLKISNSGWVKFLQSCWSVSKTYLWIALAF